MLHLLWCKQTWLKRGPCFRQVLCCLSVFWFNLQRFTEAVNSMACVSIKLVGASINKTAGLLCMHTKPTLSAVVKTLQAG